MSKQELEKVRRAKEKQERFERIKEEERAAARARALAEAGSSFPDLPPMFTIALCKATNDLFVAIRCQDAEAGGSHHSNTSLMTLVDA